MKKLVVMGGGIGSLLLQPGSTLTYDYLISSTGPRLAVDEIEGLGAGGFTESVCKTDHAFAASQRFEDF